MAHTDTEEKGYIYRDSIYWGGVVGGLGDQYCGVDLLIERGLEERGLRGEELTEGGEGGQRGINDENNDGGLAKAEKRENYGWHDGEGGGGGRPRQHQRQHQHSNFGRPPPM